MAEVEIGRVSDFFAQPVVAGIDLTGKLKKGDTVHIKGHSTDLTFTASSIQIDHADDQPALRFQHPGRLSQSAGRVGQEAEDRDQQDKIEGPLLKRQFFGVTL